MRLADTELEEAVQLVKCQTACIASPIHMKEILCYNLVINFFDDDFFPLTVQANGKPDF